MTLTFKIILRSALAIFLALMAMSFLVYQTLQPKLPQELLLAMSTYRFHAIWQLVLGISAVLFLLSSVQLVRGKGCYRLVFLCAVILVIFNNILPGPKAVYNWVSLFDDTLVLVMGVVLGLLYSPQAKQFFNFSNDFHLVTAKNLKIISLATFISFFATLAAASYSDSTLPAIFSDYTANLPDPSFIILMWALTSLLLTPILLILIFFRFTYAGYLFAFVTFLTIMVDSPAPDALTAIDSFAGFITILLSGVLLPVIFNPEKSIWRA